MGKTRSIAMAAVLLSFAFLAACGSTSTTSTGNSTSCTTKYASQISSMNLVNPGKLTVATDATYPPQEFKDPSTHAFKGMEIDLINEFAKRLCLQSDIENVTFDSIIEGVSSGSPGSQYYDMSISAFTITSARQQEVDMIPYFQAGESILVANGNPKNIQSKTDLCGLAVAVEAGTVEEGEIDGTQGISPALNTGQCAAAGKSKVNLTIFDTQDKAIQALLNGSADATYQDSPVTGYYVHLNPGKVQQGPVTVSPSPEGIVVRKDNSAFETVVTSVLADMRADGTYAKILNDWGLSTGAYPPLS